MVDVGMTRVELGKAWRGVEDCCVKLEGREHWKILAGEKLANRELFAKIFLANIHRYITNLLIHA